MFRRLVGTKPTITLCITYLLGYAITHYMRTGNGERGTGNAKPGYRGSTYGRPATKKASAHNTYMAKW